MIFMPLQCRMARAALGLGIRELALAAKVSIDTITRFERGDQLKERTIEAIQRALESAGVEFTNGEQPGVRLTKVAATRLREADRMPKATVAAQKGSKREAKRPRKRR
jgi:transcriptional regulator with XRE-family HTH domain